MNLKESAQKSFQFPEHFLWGAATSSHQVEGGNHLNDWWDWESRGLIKIPSGGACEHYTRFESDFDIAKSFGHNAHRFSIEWSRLEPARREWNHKEFDHYHRVIDALLNRGIEPFVTLHHFTLPQWIAREGGFESPRIVHYFGDYTRKVVDAFGTKVKFWCTINEPMILLFKSYVMGEWPPGAKSARSALKALKYMLLAHIRAYKIIHEYSKVHTGMRKPQVGIAHHMALFSPCRPASWKDRFSVWLKHYFSNHLFIKALQSGFLFFPGIYFENLPMNNTMDYIGVNYYSRHFVHFANFDFPGILGDECTLRHHYDAGPRNDMSWEIYPKGLFELLMGLKRYHLPIYILENGICTSHDSVRTEFIRRHVIEVAHAIQKKVPVKGYFYWSLMDNFEWDHGFDPRFGILGINYETKEREIRGSAKFYSEICKTNSVSG